MRIQSRRAAIITAGTILGVLSITGVGFAGEVTGNGKPTAGPTHANSICVFSGKNDDPTGTQGQGPGGVSQSYGQENKLGLVDPHKLNPGDACRGGSN